MMTTLFLSLFITSVAQHNCNITSQAYDSPISFGARGGWRMPRIAWHALGASEAVVVTEVAHQAGLSRKVAGWIVPVLSLGVHAWGVRTKRYALNSRDVAFDVVLRMISLGLRSPRAGIPLYLDAYASTVCWSSP